jgi:hypothetical protein
MKRTLLPALSLALVLGAPVYAQNTPAPAAAPAQAPQMTPANVRGTIVSNDGMTMVVKTKDGASVNVTLPERLGVNTLSKASMSDIKENTFVGITSMPDAKGAMTAVEVHIFPEAMRGAGEGHTPWDLMPNSTMTNGNITTAVTKNNGQSLTVKYKDGEKQIAVTKDASIVMVAAGTKDDLKVGAKVFTIAGKNAEGVIRARAVLVGKDGVTPPM